MARQGITFEQVTAAADAIVGEGQQPTIKAVRERLGTGSPNTIHQHLKRWREARPVAVVAALELPQALASAIAAEIERTAAQARGEIEGRLVQAQAEADELSATGETLEAERDALAEQVATLTTERDTLTGKAAQQAADLAEQGQRIEREQQAAEAARVELAKVQLKVEAQAEKLAEQATALDRLATDLKAADKARQEAAQAAAVLAARLEAAEARASAAEGREKAAQARADAQGQDLNGFRVQVQAQQTALDAAAREIESAKASAAEARAAAKKSGEEAAELRGRLQGDRK